MFALLFACTYPDQVAGLITVDATPPALLGLLKRAEFAASIPGATTVTVPDATHYIQVDRPDAVIDAVKTVVAKT